MYVCAHACLHVNMPLCTMESMWKSEDTMGELALYFPPRGSQGSNAIIRLGNKHLYPLDCLTDPLYTSCLEIRSHSAAQAGLEFKRGPPVYPCDPWKNMRATAAADLVNAEATDMYQL